MLLVLVEPLRLRTLRQGAPNKNIGEAFLSVWKTEDFQQTPRGGKEMSRDNWRKMRRLSLAPSAFRDKMQQAGELAADEEDEQGSRARRAPPQPTALRRIDSQDDGVDPDEDEYHLHVISIPIGLLT
jgi:hypothetical protein